MSGFRDADWFGLLTFRNSLSVKSSRVKQTKGSWLPTFRYSLLVEFSGLKQTKISYRRFGTAYQSILQDLSRPILVTDVSGQPIGFSWAA